MSQQPLQSCFVSMVTRRVGEYIDSNLQSDAIQNVSSLTGVNSDLILLGCIMRITEMWKDQ